MENTFLYNKLLTYYKEDIDKINQFIIKKKPVTLRVNTVKTNSEKTKNKLKEASIKYKEVSWYKDALILDKDENEIKKTDMYNNGEIYLQSLSSMLPPLILNPKAGETILDMAAAPGGKTMQISNMTNGKALITACEKNKIRAERLKYNLEKQETKKVTVMITDARKLDEFFSFDKILLDAPCSGSGTTDIKNIDKNLIERLAKVQKELINKAIKLLKKDGELVYSTCSILKEENEEVIKEILNKGFEIIPIEVKNIPLLKTTIDGTICICPTELYEGFFIAKLRRKHE